MAGYTSFVKDARKRDFAEQVESKTDTPKIREAAAETKASPKFDSAETNDSKSEDENSADKKESTPRRDKANRFTPIHSELTGSDCFEKSFHYTSVGGVDVRLEKMNLDERTNAKLGLLYLTKWLAEAKHRSMERYANGADTHVYRGVGALQRYFLTQEIHLVKDDTTDVEDGKFSLSEKELRRPRLIAENLILANLSRNERNLLDQIVGLASYSEDVELPIDLQ